MGLAGGSGAGGSAVMSRAPLATVTLQCWPGWKPAAVSQRPERRRKGTVLGGVRLKGSGLG